MRVQIALMTGLGGLVAAAFVGGGRTIGAVVLAVVSGALTVFGGAAALDRKDDDASS